MLDEEEIVGIGNSIPIYWKDKLENLPDEGWDWVLKKGFDDLKAGIEPNILCALSITINPAFQGKGLSAKMVKSMVQIGKKSKLDSLIVPVRPNQKKSFPSISMTDYILQKR